jgi:phosphoribosyl 1,2-cyclic phosphodiesterase
MNPGRRLRFVPTGLWVTVGRVVRVFVLGSGSSGNCLVAESEGERVILDAGMGPTRATERMRSLGADLITSRSPLGLFVTHDHGDHAAHALPIARATRAPLHAHQGIVAPRARSRLEVRSYMPGRPVPLGPFLVEALPVPHDAPHVALRVTAGGRRFGMVTDVGHASRELSAFLAACDVVFLESNYCPELLENGPYPPHLRRRVAGPLGHLSNDQAGELARSLQDTRVSRLVLVHLSRTNNSPARALDVVSSRAHRVSVEALPHGEPRRYDITGGGQGRELAAAEQLALGF